MITYNICIASITPWMEYDDVSVRTVMATIHATYCCCDTIIVLIKRCSGSTVVKISGNQSF